MLGLGFGSGIPPDRKSWNPKSIGGLSLWLRYNTEITVDTWKDQSGNGKNAVQLTEANQGSLSEGGYHFEQAEPGDYLELSTGEAAAINFAANKDFNPLILVLAGPCPLILNSL